MCLSSNCLSCSCRGLGNHITCSFTTNVVHNNNGEDIDGRWSMKWSLYCRIPKTCFHTVVIIHLTGNVLQQQYLIRIKFFPSLKLTHQSNAFLDVVNETDEYNKETPRVSGTNHLIGIWWPVAGGSLKSETEGVLETRVYLISKST